MLLRCTTKLLRLLDLRPGDLVDVSPSDEDWYGNLIWLDRRKCVLAVHAGTLFPVLAVDVRKRDLDAAGRFLISRIEAALADEGFPADALGPLDRDAVQVARTASRSILGHMTEMASVCSWELERAGSIDLLDCDGLNRFLRRELHNRGGDYIRPLDLVTQRVDERSRSTLP